MKTSPMSGQQRAEYGCTATFINDQRERLTLQEVGPPGAVLEQLCQQALKRDDTYRVLAISTPETIISDLHGREMRRRTKGDPVNSRTPVVAEPAQLGRLKLGWMLHPSLLFGGDATVPRKPKS